MRILLKIGGAQLEQPEPRAQLCAAIAAAKQAGHEILVVHGGGNQIRAASKQMGLPDSYHQGLRITDAATADVVLMVLAGKVNRTLVASLQRAGVPAVGICGADGDSFLAGRLEHDSVDLGYVGNVAGTSSALVRTLLANDFTPVIATVAPGADRVDGPFYNLNADTAASPLCRSFACEALLFLTDVDGVLDVDGRLQRELTLQGCDRLIRSGAVHGGMVPKLHAAMLALRQRVARLIAIAPAAAENCVLAALEPGHGTRFVTEVGIPDPATGRPEPGGPDPGGQRPVGQNTVGHNPRGHNPDGHTPQDQSPDDPHPDGRDAGEAKGDHA